MAGTGQWRGPNKTIGGKMGSYRSSISLIAIAFSGILTVQGEARADDTNSLPEIVVTARHRSENIEKTPVAVTSFSSETLEEIHPHDLRDVGQFAPNVAMTQYAGFRNAEIGIRGVST